MIDKCIMYYVLCIIKGFITHADILYITFAIFITCTYIILLPQSQGASVRLYYPNSHHIKPS